MSYPLMSVITPSYNRPEAVRRAVDTVSNQTYPEIEHIIVDDHSEDCVENVIGGREDVTVIRHETNKGANAARNTGIEYSKGEYIAFLDDDDIWKPSKLSEEIDLLNKSDADAVYCDIVHTYDSIIGSVKYKLGSQFVGDSSDKPSGGEELVPLALAGQFPLGGSSTLVVDQSFLQDIGLFDEEFERHQDWELLVRILKNGEITYLDQELVKKHDTGAPGYGVYIEAKRKFLGKYAEDIIKYELRGKNILGEHQFGLAKFALRNGDYLLGLHHLSRSRVTSPGRIAFLIQAFVRNVLDKDN